MGVPPNNFLSKTIFVVSMKESAWSH